MRSLDYAALGQRIRVARKAKGLTQEQLSEIIDIQPNNLSHIERGLSAGSVASLVAIATALDVTLDSLLCDSLPKTEFYLGAIEMELRKCSPEELRVVEATIKALVATMKKQFSSIS